MTAQTSHDPSNRGSTPQSEDLTISRFMLMAAFIQQGLYIRYFDDADPALFPLERIARGERLPQAPVVVLHGTVDSVVPIEHSRTLEETVRRHDSEANFELVEREGANHGFDGELPLSEPWLAEALAPLLQAWLAE